MSFGDIREKFTRWTKIIFIYLFTGTSLSFSVTVKARHSLQLLFILQRGKAFKRIAVLLAILWSFMLTLWYS